MAQDTDKKKRTEPNPAFQQRVAKELSQQRAPTPDAISKALNFGQSLWETATKRPPGHVPWQAPEDKVPQGMWSRSAQQAAPMPKGDWTRKATPPSELAARVPQPTRPVDPNDEFDRRALAQTGPSPGFQAIADFMSGGKKSAVRGPSGSTGGLAPGQLAAMSGKRISDAYDRAMMNAPSGSMIQRYRMPNAATGDPGGPEYKSPYSDNFYPTKREALADMPLGSSMELRKMNAVESRSAADAALSRDRFGLEKDRFGIEKDRFGLERERFEAEKNQPPTAKYATYTPGVEEIYMQEGPVAPMPQESAPPEVERAFVGAMRNAKSYQDLMSILQSDSGIRDKMQPYMNSLLQKYLR